MRTEPAHLDVDRELLDGVREGRVQHIKGLPGKDVLEALLPAVQCGGGDVGSIGAVHQLVGSTAPDCTTNA
jgi:hypothetical protein